MSLLGAEWLCSIDGRVYVSIGKSVPTNNPEILTGLEIILEANLEEAKDIKLNIYESNDMFVHDGSIKEENVMLYYLKVNSNFLLAGPANLFTDKSKDHHGDEVFTLIQTVQETENLVSSVAHSL